MVAKTVRLMPFMMVLVFAGCQMVPVDSAEIVDSDRRRQANEPENAELPTAGPDASGQEMVPVNTDKVVDLEESPEPDSKPEESDEDGKLSGEEASAPEPEPSEVVTRLQQQALQLQSEGRWSEAELILERALRIEADKVDLYHQLATVRLGQQRFAEAEQIALKGLSLTDETPRYKASLWKVIAQCRSAMGDVSGATEARQAMIRWMNEE